MDKWNSSRMSALPSYGLSTTVSRSSQEQVMHAHRCDRWTDQTIRKGGGLAEAA